MSEKQGDTPELEFARERAETILQFVVDGVITFDENATILSFNRAAEQLFAYRSSDVVGQNLNSLFPRPVADRLDEELEAFIHVGEAVESSAGREIAGLTSEGVRFPVLLFVNEIPVEGERLFIATVRDLSRRKELDRELERRREALEKTAHFDRCAARVMQIFNRQAPIPELLDEMLEELAAALDIYPGAVHLYDEWSAHLELAASYALPDEYRRNFEIGEGVVGEVAAKGEAIELLDSHDGFGLATGVGEAPLRGIFVVPITQMDRVLGVLTLSTQVAETKPIFEFAKRIARQIGVAIENLRKYEQLTQLSNQLNERGQRIAEQNRKLERANRMKSEFLANMSHELRTPLNAIIGFAEVLEAGIAGELNQKQTDYAHEIFDSGQHLLALINDILDLSKVEAGAMELDVSEVDLRALCRNAVSIIRETAARAKIEVTVEMDDEAAMLQADERKLKQVLYNLLSNAVKFTEDGGRVVVSTRRDGERLVLAVEDDGIGIADEDRTRLFSAFEQLDGSASRKYEGTGLGLALVKKLVELHGGTIEVSSKPGVGSRFEVHLPRTQDEAPVAIRPSRTAEAEKTAPRPRTRGSAPLVLLVEDDVSAARLFKLHLESSGYVVLHATSADEGLDLLHEASPDLLILDLLLDGSDGWGLINSMKEDAKTAHIPVVIVSITADENRKKGFAVGAAEVLQKPIAPDQLLQAIQTHHQTPLDPEDITILIVDDEPNAVEVAALPLESMGYQVLRSFSGREAIRIAGSEEPDLLVVDLMMPEVTGFDVIDAVRDNPRLADTPILVLTAKALAEDERVHLERSIQGLVTKRTFDIPEFMNEVRRVLQAPRRKTPTRARILVVDDDPADRELLRVYLEEEDFAVIEADDGMSALKVLETSTPDVIVLDVHMPRMGAAEFLDVVSRKPTVRSIPIIVVSGDDHPEERIVVAVERYLAKPIARHDLLEAIKASTRTADEETRVLIVDDDPPAIELTRSLLDSAEDIVLDVAFGGNEALDIIRNNQPDVLLLDLMMPEVDGFEVIAKLRAEPLTRELPIIIMTAKTLTRNERRSLLEDVHEVIGKSALSKISLLDEIHRVVEISRGAR